MSFIGTPREKWQRIVAAIAIMVVGPLLGIVAGMILGGLALPPDPNFVANGKHASPGDGFLVIIYVLASLAISIPVSILLALLILFRKPKTQSPLQPSLGAASPPY